MPTLHVHLREGFEGERVVVTVGDRLAFDEPSVRTRMQLGLAKMLDVEVPDGRVPVHIDLPGRARTRTVAVDAAATPYLGVSVDASGDIDATPSAELLGYV